MGAPARIARNLVLTALGLGLVAGSQLLFDNRTAGFKMALREAKSLTAEPLLPSVASLNLLSLGSPQVVADLLWVQTIQYFGSGSPYGNYPSMSGILDTITRLDPQFARPYEFGLIVLPYIRQTPGAVTLGERAQTAFTPEQRGWLDFYYGSVNLLSTKDYERAATLFEQAARAKDHPASAEKLAGISRNSLARSQSDREAAILYWETLEQNAASQDERDLAKNWKLHMQLVLQIEQAATKYKADTGAFPPDIAALTAQQYLPGRPVSPVQRELVLDPLTGKVSFDRLAE